MKQGRLRLHHRVTEVQVYHAWFCNESVRNASSWPEVVHSGLLFGCLAREAAYTHRGQRPQQFSPLFDHNEETTMDKNVFVIDVAEARQIRLALDLCRERIACPATTTVKQDEVLRELRAAQSIFLVHEERIGLMQNLNAELGGSTHG